MFVHVLEQHALVAQGDARIREPAQRIANLSGEFARMIAVDADE